MNSFFETSNNVFYTLYRFIKVSFKICLKHFFKKNLKKYYFFHEVYTRYKLNLDNVKF